MPHTAADAILEARRWIVETMSGQAGYRGAWVAGSVARLPDDAVISPGSDVDIMILTSSDMPTAKLMAHGLIFERTAVPPDEILDAERALRDYHLAPGLVHAAIIDDPSGVITAARDAVRARYREPETIRWRLDHVQSRVEASVAGYDAAGPWWQRLTSWQFAAGQLAHMLLVAALENPTIRKRYVLAQRICHETGEDMVYERLLRLAHFNRVTEAQARMVATRLGELLNVTGPHAERSAWRFASDVAPAMHAVILAGIHDMITQGHYRESMFWGIATWCRCAHILADVGEEALADPALVMDVLRIDTLAVIDQAVAEIGVQIPEIRDVADRIANQDVRES